MDFLIHRHPNSATRVDLVIVANFSSEEAAALVEVNAWNKPCIGCLRAGGIFFSKYTIYSVAFRQLVHPGFLIENLNHAEADEFQTRWEGYAYEIYQSLMPVM